VTFDTTQNKSNAVRELDKKKHNCFH